ncbi:hypothetical protein EOM39_04855 [Candidatus Gracilibacteria bacterium]|nr:hypothetical protein [Candidatus Gracilibacteria bacterium]
MEIPNNSFNILIVKNRDGGLRYYDKNDKKISDFVKTGFISMDTVTTLDTNIKKEKYEEIKFVERISQNGTEQLKEIYKEKLIKILNGLLDSNDEDVIHHHPFIGNERIDDFITYEERLRN